MKNKLVAVLILALCLSACGKPGTVTPTDKRVPAGKWHSLMIGERLNLSSGTDILRVPGGWVMFWNPGSSFGCATCYIPLSSEGEDEYGD